jgi:hypothetical protein
MSEYYGIDYSMGHSNYDTETGIRYGIISVNKVAHWIWDEFETEYTPYCPNCGTQLPEDHNPEGKIAFKCTSCGHPINDGDQWPDEPDGHFYEKEGYKLYIDSSNDLWVFKSPWVSRGVFCSPCAPGAVTLSSETTGGPQAYCLGPEWFDEHDPCPYTPTKL